MSQKLIKYIIFTTIIFLFIFNCKSKKPIINTKKISVEELSMMQADSIMNIVDSNKFTFKNIKAKLKVDFNDDTNDIKFTTFMKISNDSLITLSFSKFGISVIDVAIFKDSIFILNIMNKTYMVLTIEQLQKMYQVPIDYDFIQNILLGNIAFKNNKNYFEQKDDVIYIKSETSDNEIENINNSSINYEYNISKIFRPIMSIFKDKINNIEMKIEQSDYILKNKSYFPNKTNVYINYNKQREINMKINYNKILIDNNNFENEFSIPKNYVQENF